MTASLNELLARQERRRRDYIARLATSGNDEAAVAAMEAEDEELVRREHTELVSELGDRRAAEFEARKLAMPNRRQVDRIADALEEAGHPLDAEQRALLISIHDAQSEEIPPERLFASGDSIELNSDRFLDWAEQRLREEAEAVLTPEQLARLEDYPLLVHADAQASVY